MNPLRICALVSALLIALAACTSNIPEDAPPAHVRPEADTLDRLSAQRRAEQVSDVRYDIKLSVDADSPDYSGQVDIDFNFNPGYDPLTIDFGGGTVDELRVNGRSVRYTYNGHFVAIEPTSLTAGPNRVSIRYHHPWSNVGAGLYRFKDPEDGRSYFYSQFEIYDANRAFPSFDQPDLKARYLLTVEAPDNWTLVSATRETSIEELGPTRRWHFAETASFSTYVMSLHGGEYVVWEDPSARIPSRLFARASMARHVPVEDWFRWTRAGFDFFETWFAFEYPFGKYDQLVVPDYQFGAMENVAAVTFAERLISHGEMTHNERQNLADTIFHEMAHMWFGNLVTMRWWNGLWLNESFATYMAALASAQASEFDNAWHDFFSGMKSWGYYEDDLVTTHPVEVPVGDVREAFANFDGISYGKGASVLKQLAHRLGADGFRQGLQNYIRSNAWGNATLEDLIATLPFEQASSGERWVQDWLLTPGTSSLQANHRCFNGLLAGVSLLKEAPPQWPTSREHSIDVALYATDGSLMQVISASVNHPRTELSVEAMSACPAFVFPNHNDHTFARTRFSAEDLGFLTANAVQFADPITRDMVWQSLWSMVLNAEFDLDGFMALTTRALVLEKDPATLKSIQRYAGYAVEMVLLAWPDRDYPLQTGAALAELGSLSWQQLQLAAPGSDQQKQWLDFLTTIADSASTLAALQRVYDNPQATVGWRPDSGRRWNLLLRLAAYRYPDTLARAEAAAQDERSDEARKRLLQIRSRLAASEDKRALIEQIITDSSRNTADDQQVMGALYPNQMQDERRAALPLIMDGLVSTDASRSAYFMESYASALSSGFCDQASTDTLTTILGEHPQLSPPTRKALMVNRQENERCVAIKARMMDRDD